MLLLYCCLAPAWASRATAAGSNARPFTFPNDTFAFTNQLSSNYVLDPTGRKMIEVPRVPHPPYTLHCFVLARNARQFFQHARFDPREPRATHACYRHLIRLILARSPRTWSTEPEKIVIPGYADLYEFSIDNEALLKEEGGGAWQSFLQRGNWRMVFPFSARHQECTAEELIRALDQGRPPLVHLVCFPETRIINHVLLLFDWQRCGQQLVFLAYDPNQANRPVRLFYLPDAHQFRFQVTPYFAGGPVKVYTIYRGWLY